MKVRDSGMPDEEMWSGFFDPDRILRTFGLDQEIAGIVEFGCGYGTFTLPAAKMIRGIVNACDIEPAMVAAVSERSCQAGINNIRAIVRDFVAQGTGLPEDFMDVALLFNILHHYQPIVLMKEAYRVLHVEGSLAIIHWSKHPPAEPGALRLLAPRRGLFAIDYVKVKTRNGNI